MTGFVMHAGLRRTGSVALKYRRVLLSILAAGAGGLTVAMPADMDGFAHAGGQLLSGHLARVYDGSWNQAGPLQLIGSWLLLLGSGRPYFPRPSLAIANVCLMLLAVRVCRRAGPATSARLPQRELIVGVLTLLWLTGGTFWSGHPVEVVIPILWIAAVGLQCRGRWVRAALALGLAAAVAPWAVLAYPCLLAAAPVRLALRTAAAAAMIAACAYFPFVLSGHFAMFGQVWPIDPGTIVHRLDPALSTFGWPLRIAQAAVITAGCGFVAWRCRRQPAGAALGALTAALLRILTDPLRFDYYWVPAAVSAIATLALIPLAARRPVRVAALALAYLPWAAAASGWTSTLAALCLVIVLIVSGRDPLPREFRMANGHTRVVGARSEPT